jgi:two-component system response regulator AtoC
LKRIDEMSPRGQASLLRLLQEEEVHSAGSIKARSVDIRLIAACDGDLERAVSAGQFSEALYQRLASTRLMVPALRERRQDIPLLVDHALIRCRKLLGSSVRGIADDALERLSSYAWPGNARELQSVIERAVVLADTDQITLRELPSEISAAQNIDAEGPGGDYSLRRARRCAEAHTIKRALRATDGNRTHAAKRLAISHRALLYKIKEFNIS